ncbi:glycosyltransferase [Altibacter sp.]|uniref:glycosyltransferase n=1 Tax=Altibacter sp. TaxID=2024823 RepID=UPI000C8F6F46|nr:glycosyltransferase [Altibacter sp.]MAP55643.1 hypothetical protein [Altibacter sp.]
MKVLLVNTFDSGGAANACLRLHAGLLRAGVQSKVLLREQQKKTHQVFVYQPQPKRKTKNQKFITKIKSLLKRFGILHVDPNDKKVQFLKERDTRLEYFSFPDTPFDITNSPLYQEADIIHLHWVAEFLDFETFFRKNTKPVVWTFHDMNPFSGGEHYEETYLGMNEDGFPMDRMVSKEEQSIFKKNTALKQRALKGVANLHIVTLCRWMYNEVGKNSFFQRYPRSIIPNGIDSSVFKNRDRSDARKLLNLPLDKKVILFVADSVDKTRKGFAFLQKAFDLMDDEKIILCSIGGQAQAMTGNNQYIALGRIEDEITMSHAYSAADVFVIPSLMDNLPNTVLESLMCGTPVIGFPVGGIVDMVQHGKNGYLTKEKNAESLRRTIVQFLNEGQNLNREQIRNEAMHTYDQNVQVENHLQLYNTLLGKKQITTP